MPTLTLPPLPSRTCTVRLKRPHVAQAAFLRGTQKRKVVRAGRRGGKTTGLGILAVEQFLKGKRVLYAVPTTDQINKFWFEVKIALQEPIDRGVFKKNETEHTIELPGTPQRIRAKTAWNADTLRGDYADVLIMDEYQLMNEDAWGIVGAPMLLDNDGDAVFVYTPPSFRTAGTSKAHDPRHAAKLYQRAAADTSGRWGAWTFASHDNPHISATALDDITQDMSTLAYQQEILAQDVDEVPGALWKRQWLDDGRMTVDECPALVRLGIALDPAATSQETSDEMGMVAGGVDALGRGYLLRDASMRGTPAACARQAILLYDALEADVIIAEINNGGEWIGTVIRLVAQDMWREGERASAEVHYRTVHASRGKQTRAEPVAGLYERQRVRHVGLFPALEDQMCHWLPGQKSPDRMDAAVWLWSELLLHGREPLPDLEFALTMDGLLQQSAWR